MKKATLHSSSKERREHIKQIAFLIKTKQYDWIKAIEGAAERIVKNPESLLWS